MPLGEVLNWKVGTRIELNAAPSSPVEMRCGDVGMFRGQMGRKGNVIAVCVHDRLALK
jgi:flagellar motor switch protein FliM